MAPAKSHVLEWTVPRILYIMRTVASFRFRTDSYLPFLALPYI